MQRRSFGMVLVAEGFVTERQLSVALHHQARLRQKRLGDVLVDMGYIGRADLERAFVAQMVSFDCGGRPRRFGEYLVDEGLIRPDDLQLALFRHRRTREKRIGEILVELGFLSEQRLMEAVRAQLDLICHA